VAGVSTQRKWRARGGIGGGAERPDHLGVAQRLDHRRRGDGPAVDAPRAAIGDLRPWEVEGDVPDVDRQVMGQLVQPRRVLRGVENNNLHIDKNFTTKTTKDTRKTSSW
jgi:hypothetical protein